MRLALKLRKKIPSIWLAATLILYSAFFYSTSASRAQKVNRGSANNTAFQQKYRASGTQHPLVKRFSSPTRRKVRVTIAALPLV